MFTFTEYYIINKIHVRQMINSVDRKAKNNIQRWKKRTGQWYTLNMSHLGLQLLSLSNHMTMVLSQLLCR